MQAVFRLIEGSALGAVEHLIGDLLAPVSGQAVEHYGVGLGLLDKGLIDLEVAARGSLPTAMAAPLSFASSCAFAIVSARGS